VPGPAEAATLGKVLQFKAAYGWNGTWVSGYNNGHPGKTP